LAFLVSSSFCRFHGGVLDFGEQQRGFGQLVAGGVRADRPGARIPSRVEHPTQKRAAASNGKAQRSVTRAV
jgi:hypothetical protein